MAHIHWYPGHIAKAERKLKEQLSIIDVVIEVRDARIPLSSEYPDIENLIKKTPRLILLNKADLVDKNLLDTNGDLTLKMLQQNVGQNFISNELLNTWTTLEQKFATAIGIPNANTDKKERLIVDEVNANNTETMALVDMWYQGWQDTIARSKAMFSGLDNLSVEWRVKPMTEDLEVMENG